MNTEITDKEKLKGWILYDAECPFCLRLARCFKWGLLRHRFEPLPLQTPWVRARLGLTNKQLRAEMRFLRADGRLFGGGDALLEISRHLWWTWPLALAGRVSVVMKLIRLVYRCVARNRPCAHGTCSRPAPAIRRSSRWVDFLPLLILPTAALAVSILLPPWVFMWAMAFALYAGCKWLTYRDAKRHGVPAPLHRSLGYLLAWPGMDAARFLNPQAVPPKPRAGEWIMAVAKTSLGFALLFGAAHPLLPFHPQVAGCAGMVGTIFILHFGLFHVLSLFWRRAGVQAAPLMNHPTAAKSLSDFWGERWNAAFNALAFRYLYRPCRRRTTPAIATMLVFWLSGLLHELVISLPARGGYGLPTIYFTIQGLGLVLERSPFGARIGLGQGLRGRVFALAIAAAPACWLFPPPFIHNIILPMLQAIGAT